jgi:NAD(P)H-flavin reductase
MTAPSLDPMLPQPYRVCAVETETHDTFTVNLEPNNGQQPPRFAAGQFNMLYAVGAGEVPISISGDPGREGPLVHTIRAVGTVTQALSRLQPGNMLGLRGPFGTAWPVDRAAGGDVVLVAGGIGLAPLRPALYQILGRRDRYRNLALVYGTRTPGDLLYEQELRQWRGRFDLQVEATVDSAPPGWHGHVGVVTTLIPRVPFEPGHTVAMVCGPEIMMRFTALELEKRGVAAADIFLTMERNMKCAIGFCGHCQFGPTFICKDGPVFCYDRIRPFLEKREI